MKWEREEFLWSVRRRHLAPSDEKGIKKEVTQRVHTHSSEFIYRINAVNIYAVWVCVCVCVAEEYVFAGIGCYLCKILTKGKRWGLGWGSGWLLRWSVKCALSTRCLDFAHAHMRALHAFEPPPPDFLSVWLIQRRNHKIFWTKISLNRICPVTGSDSKFHDSIWNDSDIFNFYGNRKHHVTDFFPFNV